MKPNVFIGSSVEGLSVAYAVQQNLMHDAEVSVWDQGVFELSSTTIESLINKMASTDFGIFVFSSDDITKMRGNELNSVRDNVLFETGLFIGKLGRERVYFLIPSPAELHVPTDLLGVTPAKYEINRSDGNMQAATGPACYQIRERMKKLGPINTRTPDPSVPGESNTDTAEQEGETWAEDFFSDNFSAAKAKLEASLASKRGDEAIEARVLICYCDFKENEESGLDALLGLARSNSKSVLAQTMVAWVLQRERFANEAIKLLLNVTPELKDNPAINTALSGAYIANGEPEAAITVLQRPSIIGVPSVALALAGILEEQDKKSEALKVIHSCYMNKPRNERIRFKYARLAQDLGEHFVALYLLDGLIEDVPKSSEYWGYLGNTCVSLSLYDRALVAYRKAESLQESDNQWIVSNIGNLFKNKDLPSEACVYLERSIKMDSSSDYAHDRLAGAIKMKEDEIKVYQKKCKEGQRKIKEYEKKLNETIETEPVQS